MGSNHIKLVVDNSHSGTPRPLKSFYYRHGRALGWDTRGASSEPAKAIRAAVYRMLTQKYRLVEIYMHDYPVATLVRTKRGIVIQVGKI